MTLEDISQIPENLKKYFFRVVDGLVEDDGWCLRNGINSVNPFEDEEVYHMAYRELSRQGFFTNKEQREAILASIPHYQFS
jgi:hypothetical protein